MAYAKGKNISNRVSLGKKPIGGRWNRSSSAEILPHACMKITRSRNFHGCVGKILGEEDRFRLPPMGFSLSETRLEFFFDFELFSSSY